MVFSVFTGIFGDNVKHLRTISRKSAKDFRVEKEQHVLPNLNANIQHNYSKYF
jgi:hypothetical protein